MKGIRSTRLILGDRIQPGWVYFEKGTITAVTDEPLAGVEVTDVVDAWVSPGFIDLHTHGGGGHSFNGSVEDVVAAANFHLSHGTTCIYPTLSTAPIQEMAACVENIRKAMECPELKSTVPGAHLEGPYLSTAQMGAQRPKYITPPIPEDYLPILERNGNIIARWDYAPENDRGQAFAKALKAHGVLAAAGHTDALYSDMRAAMDQGCKLVTHLYSCTSTVTRDHGFRRLGVIETAWLEDDLYVEAIADGKHLPPALLKMIWKLKGSRRMALITDSLLWAGLYSEEETVVKEDLLVEDGVLKMLDRSAFHGSIATTDRLLRVATKEAGIPMTEAVRMLTETPAQIMGLANKGALAEGFDADIVVFDDEIQIKTVFVKGEAAVQC